jgi:hypothetical protein
LHEIVVSGPVQQTACGYRKNITSEQRIWLWAFFEYFNAERWQTKKKNEVFNWLSMQQLIKFPNL